jgi:cell division septum initiation protein DivIVA
MPRKLKKTWTYNGFTDQLPDWCEEVNQELEDLQKRIKELEEKISKLK